MKNKRGAPHSNFTLALEAIGNLALRDLREMFSRGQMAAMIAHDEIELAPINRRSGIFYRQFVPLRNNLISLLANSYRQYFKVALAHRLEAGTPPEQWTWNHLQSAVGLTIEWIRDWYILACDGENQSVRPIGQIPFAPGQTVSLSLPMTAPPFPPPKSWRAPAWLFQVSIAHVGIGLLKTKNVPANDSEERLGMAHTRLLLKGAWRVFLWELRAAIETVQNEEIAAAGAIPAGTVDGQTPGTNKPKRWRKRDTQRMVRDKLIAEIDDVAETPSEFLRLMDERKVKPQPTWKEWPGSWVQAYRNPRLRALIHKDKSRSLSRVRVRQNR